MSEYEEIRQQQLARFGQLIPEYLQRLTWPRERILAEQQAALQQLVLHAKERSPWHRERLAHIAPEEVRADRIDALPVMTKDDLMANWDAIVTEPRLRLSDAERHLQSITSDAYLFDQYHAVASGGSSGRRGVFIYSWDSWAICHIGFMRWALFLMSRKPEMQGKPIVAATIAAEAPTHMTSALSQTFSSPMTQVHRFPVTLPLREIVDGLNRVQPMAITGYPSMLAELAREAERGALRISPSVVTASSEPLYPEVRAKLKATFGATIANWWGTSEGGATGVSCDAEDGMHLAEDLMIVEPVDSEGRPVGPGATSAKVYLTNLYNPLLPLIRYEITDEVTMMDELCRCGVAMRRIADIQGRADDCFVYGGGVTVHPHIIRSPLSRQPAILEYQVAQTRAGIAVRARASSPFDTGELARDIASHLERVGLRQPEVSITLTDAIERTAAGKIKRFIPLSPSAAARA